MQAINRRQGLALAAGLALQAGVLTASAQTAGARYMYDYLFLDLAPAPGSPPRAALTARFNAVDRPAIAAAGGEVVAAFAPQLGWNSTEMALLLRWRDAGPAREAAVQALIKAAPVTASARHTLRPTVRPAGSDVPLAGGIYVHRWFEVEADSLAEFLTLSQEGWRDFEPRFEAKVFGLFEATRTEADRAAGVTRLLLMTRYRDHGVWEQSRDPTTAGMTAFARRQRLTRHSRGASTLLTAL